MVKRIAGFVAFIFIGVMLVSSAYAAQVHLAWDASPGEVTGYQIYYGTTQGNHPNEIEVGNVTNYIVTDLDEEVTYYFVARVYNQYGQSGDSNEIISWAAIANNSPTISSFTATPSSLNNPGEATTFNVFATDPDGDPLTYTISFGDGTANGSGSQVVHTYDTKGTYTATATVNDGHGGSATEYVQVVVNQEYPGDHFYGFFELEDGIVNSPFLIGADENASSGHYVFVQQGTDPSSNPQTNVTLDVTIPYESDYYMWVCMYGPSPSSDALYIGLDGTFDRVYPSAVGEYECVRVETVHSTGNYTFHLNAGTHVINVGYGEPLARADQILITSDSAFVPGQDSTPPGDVSGYTATPGLGQISLTWTNPTDIDFAGVMIRYRTDGTFPQTKDDGLPVPNGNDGNIAGSPSQSMSYVHTNLDSTKHYYYSAFSYDISNNYSQTAHADAQPLSSENQAPQITGFTAIPSSLNNPGETTTFNVSATDPDGDSLTYTVNFGDGTANGSGSQVEHTYEAEETYTAEVTVDDGHGNTVGESIQITVDDVPPTKPTGVTAN